jgi:Family of unknown function (DUF5677)
MKIAMVGNEDHWQKAFELKPDAFMEIGNLVDVVHKIARIPFTSALHRLMRHLMLTGVDSLNAVMILLQNGYTHDGLRLTRSIWEAAVTVAYLRKFPAEVDDFIEFNPIILKQQLDQYDLLYPEQTKKISKQERKKIQENYEKANPRFKRADGSIRRTWCKNSIFKMAQLTKREAHYHTFYNVACAGTHLNIYGVQMQLRANGLEVDVAPTTKFLELALITGHGAVISMMEDYNASGNLGLDTEIQDLQDRFQHIWKVDVNNA